MENWGYVKDLFSVTRYILLDFLVTICNDIGNNVTVKCNEV